MDALHLRDLAGGAEPIPDHLYEAADLDGAKPRQSFFFVTLPLLAPIVLIAVTFRLHRPAQALRHHLLLTRGGPGNATYTLSYYLYQEGFRALPPRSGHGRELMFMVMLTIISFWLVRRLLKPVEA